MKSVVLILLAAIVISLFYALFSLARDKQDSTRMLNALKVRVALSVVLVAFLLAAFSFGWLQ